MARHPYSDRFKRAQEQANQQAPILQPQQDIEGVAYEVGVDMSDGNSSKTVEQVRVLDEDDDYVQPLSQVRPEPVAQAQSKPPSEPPQIGSIVNFVYDPKTVLPAKVTDQPWGPYKQLALDVTIQVELREQLLGGPLGEGMPAIGNRRHYRGVRPDEQEELMAQQTGTMLEPQVQEMETETGVKYESKLVSYPKVRWEARAKPGAPMTAGTWHSREEGD